MSDSPQSFHVTRCDPDRNMARYYSLIMQPTLFGDIARAQLGENWHKRTTEGRHVFQLFRITEIL